MRIGSKLGVSGGMPTGGRDQWGRTEVRHGGSEGAIGVCSFSAMVTTQHIGYEHGLGVTTSIQIVKMRTVGACVLELCVIAHIQIGPPNQVY